MPTKILVATPDPAFGEWLQASLVENGGYDVHLAQNGAEVLRLAADHAFAVAILDSDLPGADPQAAFVSLARALVTQLPGLRLLVIPPENNPQHPNLTGLAPQGYLLRPFYLPGLLDTLQSLLAANDARPTGIQAPPVEVDSPVQDWLEDPGQAARELARLLLETSAQTALIAAEGHLWASAGQINPAAAAEAAALLENCWQAGRPVDLARFVRLEAGDSEHMLYAVALLDELALALLFDPTTPLTRAQRETTRLARALTAAAVGRPLPDHPAAPAALPIEADLTVLPETAALSGWLPEDVRALAAGDITALPVEASGPTPSNFPGGEWSPVDLRAALTGPEALAVDTPDIAHSAEAEEDYPDEEPVIDLAAVLAGMPSPDPGGEPVFPGMDWVTAEEAHPADQPGADEAVAARLDALSSPVPVTAQEQPAPSSVVEPDRPAPEPPAEPLTPVEEIPEWILPPSPSQTHPLHVDTTPAPGDPGKTGPLRLRARRDPPPDRGSEEVLPPVRSKAPRALPVSTGTVYTCILVPERRDYYLTGDLADRLDVWVPQLCLAFGWHLSGMVVRPGYLQWTVDLDANVSPGNVVRVIRQRTSERIFSQFPALRRALVRDDFWASGYLAVRGPRPPSASLLEGFIRQTRARQRY